MDTDTMHELTEIARDEAGDEARVHRLKIEARVNCDDCDEVYDDVTVHVSLRSDNVLWAWKTWNTTRGVRRKNGKLNDLSRIVRKTTREAIKSTRRRCLEEFGPEHEDAS